MLPRPCDPTPGRALLVLDDDGEQVALAPDEARSLLTLTGDLDAATVSACPNCRSRVVAVVAFVDILEDAPPHPRSADLLDLADEAPTMHLYVVDAASDCTHEKWHDPGYEEWLEVTTEPDPRFRRRAQ